MLITVVIPTYQRCAAVTRAVLALAQQTIAPEQYEVIVVIDGSTDGSRPSLAAVAVPYALQILWQPNQGRAAARNLGLSRARGEVVVMLDDDMCAAPGLLEAHRRAHTLDGPLAVLGPVPIAALADAAPVRRYIADKFNRHLDQLAQPGHVFQLRDFYSGNVSVGRDILQGVGGFDSDFRQYGNEDLELAVRLQRVGVRVAYCPAAVAHQDYDKDFAGLAQDTLAKGRTAVMLAGKHPETLGALQLSAGSRASRARRLVRNSCLLAERVWPGTPAAVAAGVGWLEKRWVARLPLVYAVALDYFYWQGVALTLRDNRRTGRDLQSLAAGRP